MATLYDLELQESNNFIHALKDNGQTPALKLVVDQKEQFAAMGEAGKALVEQIEDPTSEMGKSLARLQEIQAEVKKAMDLVGLTSELATQADLVFMRSPESLTTLSPEDQEIIKDYWLKKKSIIVILLQKGYGHQELFA